MDSTRSRSRCHRERKASASSNDAKSASPNADAETTTPSRLLYKVRNWDKLFENAQSRKCGQLSWVKVPNKHDGKSYRRLIAYQNGPALYAAWMLILQVASKCPIRGVLGDDDGPLDADDLSHKTGCPAELFAVALKMLSEPRIGWLEVEQVGAEGEPAPSPLPEQSTDAGQNRTGQNGTEPTRRKRDTAAAAARVNGAGSSAVDPQLLDWLRWWNSLKAASLVEAGVNEQQPSQAIRRAWTRTKADAVLSELLRDRGAIEREIQACPFCRGGWFSLQKLLAGVNRDCELIVKKLLDGAYRDRKGEHHGKPTDQRAGSNVGTNQREDFDDYIRRKGLDRHADNSATSVAAERPAG